MLSFIRGARTGKKQKVRKSVDYSRVKNYDLSFLVSTSSIRELVFDVEGGTNYLLLIAVDKYKYWKPLNNAVKDARDVKAVLMEKYGFKPENIYELLDQEVTPENVEEQFRILQNKGTNQDRLLIYYAGHGFYDPAFDLGYWVPAYGKTNSGATATYIPNDHIRNYIKEMKFRHVFLAADACFSGSLFMSDTQTRGVDKAESVKSRWGLSSGNLEVISDGKKGENSPFARYFIKYLKDNLQDRVLVENLAKYVEEMVEKNTEQDPIWGQLSGVGSEGGQFVFSLQGQKEESPSDPKTKKK